MPAGRRCRRDGETTSTKVSPSAMTALRRPKCPTAFVVERGAQPQRLAQRACDRLEVAGDEDDLTQSDHSAVTYAEAHGGSRHRHGRAAGARPDGVAVLTLNLPERRNALTEPMLTALAATLRAVEADDDVGCVVLTGAGGAFCAGGDVKAMAEEDDPTHPARPFDARVQRQRDEPPRDLGPAAPDAQADDRGASARRPVPGLPWRWPATCATRRRTWS